MNAILPSLAAALWAAVLSVALLAPAHAQSHLADDPAEAGMTCWFATLSDAFVTGGEVDTELTAHASWYLLEVARLDTADNPAGFIDRVYALADADASDMDSIIANSGALIRSCAARYPLNARSRPVTLPQDPFRRDLLCSALGNYLVGVAEAEEMGTSSLSPMLADLMTRIDARMTDDALTAQGLVSEDQVTEAFVVTLREASTYGNLLTILDACDAAVP